MTAGLSVIYLNLLVLPNLASARSAILWLIRRGVGDDTRYFAINQPDRQPPRAQSAPWTVSNVRAGRKKFFLALIPSPSRDLSQPNAPLGAVPACMNLVRATCCSY
jgi:hypothetical protein